MIEIPVEVFHNLLRQSLKDIQFLQAECQRAEHNHAVDPRVKTIHENYELSLKGFEARLAQFNAEAQTEAEAASLAPVSSQPEPSASADESQTTA